MYSSSNQLFNKCRQISIITSANSQKPADVTRKVAHSRASSENYLLFENNNRARADDSHYKVSHAFVTNMKIGNVAAVQFSVLSRASHFEQVITRAAS